MESDLRWNPLNVAGDPSKGEGPGIFTRRTLLVSFILDLKDTGNVTL